MLKALYVYGTGSTDESVSIVGLWPLLTPPVGVNRHCVLILAQTAPHKYDAITTYST